MKKLYNFEFSNIVLWAFLAVLVVAAFAVGSALSSRNVSKGSRAQKESVPQAKARQNLNREFSFAIKDDKDKEIGKIKYIVQSAELADEIIVKGEKARAVVGKTFLILSIKIVNDLKQGVSINTRDFIRLSVNGGRELLAPNIHNDPVAAQAISTTYTRLGFTINESDKNLELHIGEIAGPKQTIQLNLKSK